MRSGNDKAGPRPKALEIGIVLFPGVQLAAVFGLTDLFTIANRSAPSDRLLRVTHWRLDSASGAMDCVFDSRPSGTAEPAVLVLPPTLVELPEATPVAIIAAWLKACHAAGATLASVCSGAFLLAATGLLDGRVTATHWSCAADLGSRFPAIRIDVGERLVDHDDVITAGGVMAWVDLGLKLVERFLGAAAAGETARFLVAAPVERARPRDFRPNLGHGDEAIIRVQNWLHTLDARGVSIAEMAAAARLEKRTFLRRFGRATGMAPGEYCRRLRVTRAVELLEGSRKSAAEIAWSVGYANAASFAKAFRRFTGVSPGAYRQGMVRRRGPGGATGWEGPAV